VVRGLRPPALEQLGLVAALRGFLVDAADVAATRTDLRVIGGEVRLTPQTELGAFRIAQEAVNNAIRHAGADHLWLTIVFGDGGLCLRVADNGHGFDPAALAGQPQAERLGLLGMRERAALLGGRLKVRSAPGQGTVVEATLPSASEEQLPPKGNSEADASRRSMRESSRDHSNLTRCPVARAGCRLHRPAALFFADGRHTDKGFVACQT
jgi:two-component system, NarL family, sensor histidine kinase DegS